MPADPLVTAILKALDAANASPGAAFRAQGGSDLRAQPLVVGVSGGPDSMALLHALRVLWSPDRLVAAHLDHGLRPDSAEDAATITELASRWNLRLVTDRREVRPFAEARRLTVEEAARTLRYRFLADVARQVDAQVVAVGHHGDDQAETVLMRVLRGSGLAGLRGMSPMGPMPEAPHIWLWRPLLNLRRTDIMTYCETHTLAVLADPSNDDTSLFRNRLRHETLPNLESISPRLTERLNQMAAIIAADDDLLRALEEEAWQALALDEPRGQVALDLQGWRAMPLGLRRRLLRRGAFAAAPGLRDLGFTALEQARALAETGHTGATAVLPGGLSVVISYKRLVIARDSDPSPPPGLVPQLTDDEPRFLLVPGEVELDDGWRLTAERVSVDRRAVSSSADPWRAFISPAISPPFLVRSRQPGERLQPPGLQGHHTKVKEMFIDRKVPAAYRRRWPLVATKGHLIWIPGHLLDYRARLVGDEAEAILLRCRPPV